MASPEELALEQKVREVVQLLKEYRAWHTAFGGSVSLDEGANMKEAAYGPAGLIEEGMYYRDYPRPHFNALKDSYDALEKAINKIKRRPHAMFAFLLLRNVYFGDPADWRIAERWKEVGDYRLLHHEYFIVLLAEELIDTELHPIWPKPYSEKEEKSIERQNAEIYATYQRIRASGATHNASVAQTAAIYSLEQQSDLSADAVERIIEFRDTLKVTTCTAEGCNREPERGTLCMRHYMQARRRAKRQSETDSEEAC